MLTSDQVHAITSLRTILLPAVFIILVGLFKTYYQREHGHLPWRAVKQLPLELSVYGIANAYPAALLYGGQGLLRSLTQDMLILLLAGAAVSSILWGFAVARTTGATSSVSDSAYYDWSIGVSIFVLVFGSLWLVVGVTHPFWSIWTLG